MDIHNHVGHRLGGNHSRLHSVLNVSVAKDIRRLRCGATCRQASACSICTGTESAINRMRELGIGDQVLAKLSANELDEGVVRRVRGKQ